MKGNDSTDQGKTKHTQNADKSRKLTKHKKRQTQGQTGLYELFLLTVKTHGDKL